MSGRIGLLHSQALSVVFVVLYLDGVAEWLQTRHPGPNAIYGTGPMCLLGPGVRAPGPCHIEQFFTKLKTIFNLRIGRILLLLVDCQRERCKAYFEVLVVFRGAKLQPQAEA